uniref:Uncharacterized protein n=1 Tax=Pavo cristatus TaxID=9049 RepID=A0A8C9G0A8_PAVCR
MGVFNHPTTWPTGGALFGKVTHKESALRSMIFHPKVLLAAPEKAFVRLSKTEDSDGPLLGHLMIAGKKCTSNLIPPSGPSDYHIRLCILGGHQLGQPPG